MRRLAIIGGGFMGTAFATGLLESGSWEPEDIVIAEVRAARRDEISRLGLKAVEHAAEAARVAFTVLLAVKPQDMATTLVQIAPEMHRDGLVVSIAAGIRLATLEAALPGVPVVRVMPNTPAARRAGAAALAAGRHANAHHLEEARGILSAVGTAVVVREEQLDAVTGVSGTGPAYVFLLAEAMIAAGIELGLEPDTAEELVIQTIAGAGVLLRDRERSPEELRIMVTSPNGTTARAMQTLEGGDFRGLMARAIADATQRSRELGS